MPLTELQKMQAAYAYFTLDEWKLIVQSLKFSERNGFVGPCSMITVLQKCPSAAREESRAVVFIKVIDLQTQQEVDYQPYMRFNPLMTICVSQDGVYWSMYSKE